MIYIIRHGKTELNKANVLQGQSDHPLNEDGIEEAAEIFRSGRDKYGNFFSIATWVVLAYFIMNEG